MEIKINTRYFKKLDELLAHLNKSNSYDLALCLNTESNTFEMSYDLYDRVVDELYDIAEKDNSFLDLLEFLLNKDKRKETI